MGRLRDVIRGIVERAGGDEREALRLLNVTAPILMDELAGPSDEMFDELAPYLGPLSKELRDAAQEAFSESLDVETAHRTLRERLDARENPTFFTTVKKQDIGEGAG